MDGDRDVVEVVGLSKTFRSGARRGPKAHEKLAVDSVSFSVPPRGSLGIVGESGSGKTTLGRMLLGLVEPDAGTISIAGRLRDKGLRRERRTSQRTLRAKEVQVVFQDPFVSLDPRQTARDGLDELLKHHGYGAKAERALRVAELADLVALDDRKLSSVPRNLSGGEIQRVAIARALAVEPAVLILDEAVSALDVSIQAQVLNLLADIRAETEVAYIFISHDLAVVRQITDRLAVMQEGRIVELDETGRVLDAPSHPYTAMLRQSVPRPGWRPNRRAEAR